ncbi:MAG: Zn-dependent hydrolase [Bacteroidetes bacterium]|nr:Zn-dependent hydrolase [Bacteroidota bacterium]
MVKKTFKLFLILAGMITMAACTSGTQKEETKTDPMDILLNKYVQVSLTADISHLSANEKEMLSLLFKAATIMDDIFWTQNIGPKDAFLSKIEDPKARKFAEINYGPWDQLDNQKPFLEGFGTMPPGAQFYPVDMTKEEFEAFEDPNKTSLYTLIVRDDEGNLKSVWYHEVYAAQIEEAALLLEQASELAGDAEFASYLKLRAKALRTDDYLESDMAWMDVRNNNVDLVIGPIENYVDGLFGYKAAHEAFILIKDIAWSDRLSHYAKFLPDLQKQLPVEENYKKEVPGSDADLNAYDVVFYAGDCNMAGKTIAINLPNDEKVHLEKGSRKLQLKNSMKAKFDNILVPISTELIAPEQRKHITFDAFFSNTMFHEVAHGMGIKNTIDGTSTVRKALREQYSPLEEAKADILGLFLVTKLHEMGEFRDTELMDNYVTFMAGFFRSVRFGAASAHGKANMMTFNYFLEEGAFSRSEDGTYAIDMEKMMEASRKLTGKILMAQGNGDYEMVKEWISSEGVVKPQLQADLDRITEKGIPVDIYFEMGPQMLGLK